MPNHWIAAVLVTLSFYLHHRCTMSGYVGLRHCAYEELTSFQYNIAAIIYVIMHSLIIYVITYNGEWLS
jgi:hypothetical protein